MNMQQEALARATQSPSMANYAAIFQGFGAKGLPETEIKPRENVFTYDAWKALGRQVKKGEHGVKVCTWIVMTKKDSDGVAQPIGKKPRMTTVFHISQTDPISAVMKEEAKPEAQPESKPYPATDWAGTPNPQPAQEYYSTEFTQI